MSRRMIEERISSKYRQKLGKVVQNRLDLTLADYEMLDKDKTSARILIAYNSMHGEPKKSDVERFVWSQFDQKLSPMMETAKVYPKQNVVDVVVEATTEHKTFDNKAKMAAIVPNKRYVDREGVVWTVNATEDGTKFLVRKSEENIEEILTERRKYVNAAASLPSLRKLHKEAGYVNAQEGDLVEFYQGTQLMKGKISSIGKDGKVKVNVSGTTITIARPAILRVLEHSAAYKREKMNMLKNYFEKYLGPELASKLVGPGDNAAEGENPTNR